MNHMRSALFLPLLFAGLVSVAHGGRDDTATNPRDFDGYYAPAYQLPDPALMTPAMAKGKELIHSTYKYLGAESGRRAATRGRPNRGKTSPFRWF